MSSNKEFKERVERVKKSLKKLVEDTAEKALTTRKLHIPPSAGIALSGQNIHDSAMRGNNRAFSTFRSRDGVLALNGAFVEDVTGNYTDPQVIKADPLSTCKACGLTSKSSACPKCAQNETPSCDKCGDMLVKQIGGSLGCPGC
jgi:hypothetical protein